MKVRKRNMSQYNILFDEFEFDGVYRYSSDFPQNAVQRIPSKLLDSINSGKKGFFKEFKECLPEFYRVLMEKASDVFLLETSVIGLGLGQREEEFRNYYWGLKCAEKLITARLPVTTIEKLKLKYDAEYLPCLPSEFHCFYKKSDGMSIAIGEGPGGSDLAASYSDWESIEDYAINNCLSLETIGRLYKEFENNDLRIFIQGSLGDIIFLNFSQKDKKLYHVANQNFSDYKLIRNPSQTLDIYFADAVLGFSKGVNLS